MDKSDIKEVWKKIWDFLWNDDSIWSWIVSLILAFIIVKFIFFPLLSLIFANSMPLVVVESSSMHHPASFLGDTFGTRGAFNIWWDVQGNWYESRNITQQEAALWPIRTGFEIGDIVLLSGYNKNKLKIGDIIIFNAGQAHPIIHRIINITNINGQTYYSTKGDNNPEQLSIEKQIPQSSVIGKAIFKIPKLGWVKLWFTKLIS